MFFGEARFELRTEGCGAIRKKDWEHSRQAEQGSGVGGSR